MVGFQRGLSIVLGLGIIFSLLAPRKVRSSVPIVRLVDWLKKRMAISLRRGSLASLSVIGLLNGLLPCGLVYVACAAATVNGAVLRSIWQRSAPGRYQMMLGISISGKAIPVSFRLRMHRAIPITVFLLGTLLVLRGMSLGIPYVSPDLASTLSCCHK